MAEWFAPKRYGYGSGRPIAWQGWALLIGYIMLIGLASFLMPYSLVGYYAIVAVLTIIVLRVAALTTKGGWRWRSGKED